MNKLIVTRWNQKILTALMINDKCRSLKLASEDDGRLLGAVYIGKVKNVVKNIGAAFVDLGGGQMGYYSLTENRDHLFTDRLQFADTALEPADTRTENARTSLLRTDALTGVRPVKAGDELIVQVARDAVKTKDPVLSCYLNITGKYAVLTLGKPSIGFSAKIKDPAFKEAVREYLRTLKNDDFGIIVRTNAADASLEEIGAEVLELKDRLYALLEKGTTRTCYSLLDGAEPSYVLSLRDTYAKGLGAIVTDDKNCYEQMHRYLEANQREDLEKLSFYEDPLLPLIKLYSLETALEEALGRRVWLKSGGYLVIEPTEALTVIDVNTGKYAGKKNVKDTILKINLEAAEETARQLQLRNLSGIIIVDFIDMESEAHKEQLLKALEMELQKDPVKTVLVEMTKLGLVEITRKKVSKPLHEMV